MMQDTWMINQSIIMHASSDALALSDRVISVLTSRGLESVTMAVPAFGCHIKILSNNLKSCVPCEVKQTSEFYMRECAVHKSPTDAPFDYLPMSTASVIYRSYILRSMNGPILADERPMLGPIKMTKDVKTTTDYLTCIIRASVGGQPMS